MRMCPAYAHLMEIRLQPALAAKVEQLSAQTGRPASEVVEEAVTGYFGELEQLRNTLDNRYDDVVNGRVESIEGPEAVRLIKERAAARRKSIA